MDLKRQSATEFARQERDRIKSRRRAREIRRARLLVEQEKQAEADASTRRTELVRQRAEHQAMLRARRMEYVEMAKYGGRNFMNKARRGKKGRKEP